MPPLSSVKLLTIFPIPYPQQLSVPPFGPLYGLQGVFCDVFPLNNRDGGYWRVTQASYCVYSLPNYSWVGRFFYRPPPKFFGGTYGIHYNKPDYR